MALPESAKEETERQENEENGGNEENEEVSQKLKIVSIQSLVQTFQGESPGEEDSTERIVVLPEEEEEDFDDVLRVPRHSFSPILSLLEWASKRRVHRILQQHPNRREQ